MGLGSFISMWSTYVEFGDCAHAASIASTNYQVNLATAFLNYLATAFLNYGSKLHRSC